MRARALGVDDVLSAAQLLRAIPHRPIIAGDPPVDEDVVPQLERAVVVPEHLREVTRRVWLAIERPHDRVAEIDVADSRPERTLVVRRRVHGERLRNQLDLRTLLNEAVTGENIE